MEFVFKESSCVAIGTFNIYIIQPKMLCEMGIIAEGTVVGVFADFTQPGIRFQIRNTTWTVRPERLAIETTDPNEDCGKLIASVLRTLRWTPVMAIGANVTFRADPLPGAEFNTDFKPPALQNSIQNTCHTSIQLDGSRLNIQLSSSQDEIELILNRHCDLKQIKKQDERIEAAIAESSSFLAHRYESVKVANSIITQGTFSYEHADTE